MIRVCIVEDQTIVRQGIRALLDLAGDITVVAEASDGEEAVKVLLATEVDVALLDMRLPKRSGLDVMEMLRRVGRLPSTLILTTFDDDELLLGGIRAGAKGFLLKDVSLDQLTHAIRTLATGGTLIQPAVTQRALRALEKGPSIPSAGPSDRLTPRETEILRLLAGGFSNREIAQALSLSEGTVKNHISNVLSKIGVRDRTRAVLKALEEGLI